MIASITAIFGYDVNKSVITALVSSTIGTGGATVLGKTAVANILKLFPGAGTVVGSTISAGTASLITIALGEAYIALLALVFEGKFALDKLNTEEGKELMSKLFKESLSKKRD